MDTPRPSLRTNTLDSSNFGRYGIVWALVLVAHLAGGWFIVRTASPHSAKPVSEGPFVVISLEPEAKTRITSRVPIPLFTGGAIVREIDVPLLGAIVDTNSTVSARHTGGTTPPHPEDLSFDAKTFARNAGLQEGSGATVVLRVEVHGSGAVGKVEIDVSGGSRRIDQAAIAYVRSLKWVGGRIGDRPETLWVRWGVRLDG